MGRTGLKCWLGYDASEFFGLCVVVLTSPDHIRDVNEAYHLGANSFLVKPQDFENAGELARSIDILLAKVAH